MNKTYILAAIAGLLLGPTAAIAGSGEYRNTDAMWLAKGKGVKTTCDISEKIGGKSYCFGDEKSHAEFMKDPEGNRAKADAYYTTKISDPNWVPCDYSSDSSYNGCE
jgi:YHS domain-containing protein